MSNDEFHGYKNPNEIPTDGFDDAVGNDGEDSESNKNVPPIPDFQQPFVDMTDKSPLDFFKLLVTDEMLDHMLSKLTSMLNNILTQPPSLHTLAYTAETKKFTTKLSLKSSWP